MHFKKLELVGFKSFFAKTTLHFEPGITAVVGPNGCGKSNIVDSMRWVLGEQSAKALRGSDMQDVIFNGSDSKEPCGMAEVTLTFDNENRFFNFDHPELAITRRLFRSGESEYQINKNPVRLKDIMDLLLGTGVGAESYSIVAQGKIDLVLSSRPEDRRLVFDEASGITKYKSQKRETMRKMEETEQNLLRVGDIIAEVKRQISSLERQANKARRYKEVFEELRQKEMHLSFLQKKQLLEQKSELSNQLKELEAKEVELANLIKEEESRIASRRTELKTQEDSMMSLRNQILNLENQTVRNNERINFNKEKLTELSETKRYLAVQSEQVKNKLVLDEEKLSRIKIEFSGLRKDIEAKTQDLKDKEARINNLASLIKNSLEAITSSKKGILELEAKIAGTKNEISDFNSRQQIFMARQKRLEIEKAKAGEERASTEDSLNDITAQMSALRTHAREFNLKISGIKTDLEKEGLALSNINALLDNLEKQKLTLESHREFLQKVKTKYEDIGESMNALIYLDRLPLDNVSGLVIKVKEQLNLSDKDKESLGAHNFKLSGEAKPIELDTRKIDQKLKQLEDALTVLRNDKESACARIQELNTAAFSLEQDLRSNEIALANKQTTHSAILEQFNKIKEEEEVILMELQDVEKELSGLAESLVSSQERLAELNKERAASQDLILKEENNISLNSKLREELLVAITQAKTELEAMNKSIVSEEATVKVLEDTFSQDKENLENLEKQLSDAEAKLAALDSQIRAAELDTARVASQIQNQNILLKETQVKYRQISDGAGDALKKIDSDRVELDAVKNKLYQLQVEDKDIDYKYEGIKARLFQAYKIDLETCLAPQGEVAKDGLGEEIEALKEKLDSYGTVNLVAIEEYDELKKRYDFLIQQQNDLLSAKDSLHQAILKINRTTKQMFLDTFEKVRIEFRNYFRVLFGGGDAQLFLIDEQDVLESGIEIICRPPGKKLQNVLLLSGGEKSLSAIALIFAIFKVKPSPFCILDEIDAALDEANVDRFSKMLQEFAQGSQFIVITHNKKTIVNANVMYGITMEESGVSKIVSVKFAKDLPAKDKEADVAVPEPV